MYLYIIIIIIIIILLLLLLLLSSSLFFFFGGGGVSKVSRVVAKILHHSSPIDSIRRMFISTLCKYLTTVLIGHPVSRMDGNVTRPDTDLVYWITIDFFRGLTIAINSKCFNWESSCTLYMVFPLFSLHARTHTSNTFKYFLSF